VSVSHKRKQLRRKTLAGYGNTYMLQMQMKSKCLLKSRGELSIGRRLGAVAGRIPHTGREATAQNHRITEW